MDAAAAPLSQGFGAVLLWSALVLGLSGGFGHCLMMCGPLVSAVSLAGGATSSRGAEAPRSAWLFQAAYHGGRLATYAAIGALLGLLGGMGRLSTLEGPFAPASLARYVKLSTGLVLVVTGLWLMVSWALKRTARLPETSGLVAGTAWFKRATARLARGGWRWALPLGMLMGLMPCGPLLPVELAALGTSSPAGGAAVMLAFGIGTVPALAGFGAASGLVGERSRGWLTAVTALAILILGGSISLQALQSLKG
ncbi:MAG: sulfite exporter TauE/SafE family protein [Actinobacteria bacterium]|nr:sulfite exporter TauE/SafE family protein [Actinomycetota bacterium]MCG2808521.1 sulfite exporter TauE/SafE family protein [Coriobacteriia bacterium]